MKFRFFFLFVLLFSCKKKMDVPIQLIGHAGMGLEFSGSVYHANSKEAMTMALEMTNLGGVELDVRMAADGSLWLSHDETLESETHGSGCLANKKADELQTIVYKTLKNEKLANLDEVEIFKSTSKGLFFDIKHANFCDNSIQNVNQFLDALDTWSSTILDAKNKVKIILSNPAWIDAFIQNGWTVLFSSDDQNQIQQSLIDFPGLTGIVAKNKSCTADQVVYLKNQGKEIYLYEVRSPKALKEVRKKIPTGVMSDDVQGAILEFR